MISVLLVDDHPALRMGVATLISSEEDMEVIGEADCAKDAMEILKRSTPDIVIVDIRLKGGSNGIELARWVKDNGLPSKLLVFTNYSNLPYINAMMELGIQGYLLKNTPSSEVLEAIRMASKGRNVFSAEVTQALISSVARR